jgi:hypothetical protein
MDKWEMLYRPVLMWFYCCLYFTDKNGKLSLIGEQCLQGYYATNVHKRLTRKGGDWCIKGLREGTVDSGAYVIAIHPTKKTEYGVAMVEVGKRWVWTDIDKLKINGLNYNPDKPKKARKKSNKPAIHQMNGIAAMEIWGSGDSNAKNPFA